jgi:hypothetical protein
VTMRRHCGLYAKSREMRKQLPRRVPAGMEEEDRGRGKAWNACGPGIGSGVTGAHCFRRQYRSSSFGKVWMVIQYPWQGPCCAAPSVKITAKTSTAAFCKWTATVGNITVLLGVVLQREV